MPSRSFPSPSRRARHARPVVVALCVLAALAVGASPAPAAERSPGAGGATGADAAGQVIETAGIPTDGIAAAPDAPRPSHLVVTRALPFDTARALVVDTARGRVYVSGDDEVAVTDLAGTLLQVLPGHPGANGMVLVGSTLYVAQTTTGGIGRVTVGATATNATPIATGLVNPREVAYAGGALWTVTGACGGLDVPTLTRIALPEGTVTTHPTGLGFLEPCTLLDGSADRLLLALPVPTFTGRASIVDVSTPTPSEVIEVTDGMPSQVRDVALMPGAGTALAAGYPLARSFTVPDMTVGAAYTGPTLTSATSVAATTARGGLVAVGRGTAPNLSLHTLDNPTATWAISVGVSVIPNGIGFNADASKMYVVAQRAATVFDLHVIDVDDATSQFGEFHPLRPSRVFDSRATGLVKEAQVPLLSRGDMPAGGVSAVALNVTVTDAPASGYLSVYPAGQNRPNASTLNFRAGQTVPNMAIVGVGPTGAVSLYAETPAHVIIDVVGWFGTATAPSGSLYHPVLPFRWFDTRLDARGDGTVRPVGPDSWVTASATGGRSAAASGIGAVALNVTAANTTSESYLRVAPPDSPPGSSHLNWKAGETVPNAVISMVHPFDGRVQFTNKFGTTDVLADVFGFWDDGNVHSGKRFFPVAPERVVDTRRGYLAPGSTLGSVLRLGPDEFVSVKVDAALPAAASAVAMNITAVNPSAGGYLSAFPLGVSRDVGMQTSVVNFVPGDVRPNMAILPIGIDGEIVIVNGSGGTVDILADMTGYFL